jgi:hypothetical protein
MDEKLKKFPSSKLKQSGSLLERQFVDLRQRYDSLQNELTSVREDQLTTESSSQTKGKNGGC